MISANNLPVNINTKLDTGSAPQDTNSAASTGPSVSTKTGETQEDTSSTTSDTSSSSQDPSTFIMLLSQMSVEIQPQPEEVKKEGSTEKSQIVDTLLNPENAPAVADKAAATLAGASAQEAIPQEDNPALHWLDDEQFKSFAQKGNLLERIANTADKTEKTVVPEAVKLAVATNNEPVKDNAQQTAQTLSEALFASSSSSKNSKSDEPVEPTAVTSQLVTNSTQPQQPVHTDRKTLNVSVPVSQPQWSEKVSEHIVWLGKNDIKSAIIKIHPEELGPIEINIKVVKDNASVNIASHSPQVRDLMDQAIPRLRELMSDQGLNLSNIEIGDNQKSNNFAQNNQQQEQQDEAINEQEDNQKVVTTINRRHKGLIDYFA